MIVAALGALGVSGCIDNNPTDAAPPTCANANCASEATCSDESGAAVCSCNEGFSGDGIRCDDNPVFETGPRGAQVTDGEGDTVIIPAGALSDNVFIAISVADPTVATAPPTPDDGFVGQLVTFTPHGTQFGTAVTITIKAPPGANQVLRRADENDTTWEIVPNVTFANGFATFLSTTFSIYTTSSPKQKCQPGEYQSSPPSPFANRECTTLTECTSSEFESTSPTATSDRVCAPLTACTPEEYEGSAPTDTANRICLALTACATDEFQSVAPTATSDRECQALTVCSEEQFESTAPTDTANRVCSSLTVCATDEWLSAAPTATSDRACSALTVCGEGEYASALPTATSDRACSALRVCDASEYQSVPPTAISNRVCTALAACTEGQYETQAPTATSNRECAALTACTEGEYESTAPTSMSNRECTALTACTAGEYESTAPTSTSNRECTTLTACTTGEYESQAPTSTSNRECTTLTACTAGEYESTAPTETSNRECTALTACTAGEYESQAPTETSNRECTELTACTAGEYESQAPTETSNRECTALTVCAEGEVEVVAPTATSDRECEIGQCELPVHDPLTALAPAWAGNMSLSSFGFDGFILTGLGGDDNLGTSVASGDINGDGIGDVIAGARSGSFNGGVYIVFGPGQSPASSGTAETIDISALDGTNGFAFYAPSTPVGEVVATGDINGDCIDDVIVGAPTYSSNSGSVFVIFGDSDGFPATLAPRSLTALNGGPGDGSQGFRISLSASGVGLGKSVATADINADGLDDILIGSTHTSGGFGTAYVVYGKRGGFGPDVELEVVFGPDAGDSTLDGTNGFMVHGALNGRAVEAVGNAGDLNGDGLEDMIIGQPTLSVPQNTYTGTAFVLFGSDTGFAGLLTTDPFDGGARLELAQLDGSNGFKMTGASGDRIGKSVGGAVDVNGDDVHDALISGEHSNRSYVVFGKASQADPPATFDATLSIQATGGNGVMALSGTPQTKSIASAGDVNGDGVGDVALGFNEFAGDGSNGCSAYYGCDLPTAQVVFGDGVSLPDSVDVDALNADEGRTLSGAAVDVYSASGRVSVGAGDINGDGRSDGIFGDTISDSVFVVFGASGGE